MNELWSVGIWLLPLEILFCTIIAEMACRFKWMHCVLMFVVPILFAHYWITNIFEKNDWFGIVKVYSVTLIGGTYLSARWMVNEQWVRRFQVFGQIGLSLNILEAVALDFQHNNYINALNGIILCLCQPFDITTHQPRAIPPYYEAVWHLSGVNRPTDINQQYLYPLAYCFWNFCFCYGTRYEVGIVHLVVPLLLSSIRGWSFFLMYRAYGLAVFLEITLTHKNGRSWFYWDQVTFMKLYYRSDYHMLAEWLAVVSVLALVYRHYLLFITDTKPDRVISFIQVIFKALGVKG